MIKALVAAARDSDGNFRHAVQRARDDREQAAQTAALIEAHTATGITVIDQPDYDDKTIKALKELAGADGQPITAETHTGCPGHAVYIAHDWRGVDAVPVCQDWKDHGHRDRYNNRPSGSGPMDEKAKAERRAVIAYNRDWKSASAVRREWITAVLTRRTPPKGAATYLAGELARGGHELRRAFEQAHPLAATVLGADPGHTRQSVTALADQSGTGARAQVIALAVVLAAVDAATGVHTWRHPDDTPTTPSSGTSPS